MERVQIFHPTRCRTRHPDFWRPTMTAGGPTSPCRSLHANPALEPARVFVELAAVVVAVADDCPRVLIRRGDRALGAADALPSGPFVPAGHRTLEAGLRSWVEEQTGTTLGYVEQLYTFGDDGRQRSDESGSSRVVSIGYLALTRHAESAADSGIIWQDWYRYFPWEDWRQGRPGLLDEVIEPALERWIARAGDPMTRQRRRERAALCFAIDQGGWDEERVLERYELLYEVGMVGEAVRDAPGRRPGCSAALRRRMGTVMRFDHRRILATAMGRLRGKLKYRPVVFELMPPAFTLLQLQRTVEAVAGTHLHKQNFRRLVEQGGLVERTGLIAAQTGGRPAEQFRFRREVLRERPAPGVKLPGSRTGR